jgi:hypothetical protein
VEGLVAQVVVGLVALLPDHEAPHLYLFRLEVYPVDAVVADEGVGGDDNLPGVGGVGEHLLVADHAGIEDDLAVAVGPGAEGVAFKDRAVGQD